jgi:hypothetical protein
MTTSKGPTLLIAHLRRAAEKRHPTDERASIFTQAADCLDAQADKIRHQSDEIEKLRKRLQPNTKGKRPAQGTDAGQV